MISLGESILIKKDKTFIKPATFPHTRGNPVFIQRHILGQFLELQATIHFHLRPLSHGSPSLCLNTVYPLPAHPSLPLFSAYFTRGSYVLHMFHRYQERATRLLVRISTFLPYSTGRRTEQVTIIFPRLGYVRLSAMLLHSPI